MVLIHFFLATVVYSVPKVMFPQQLLLVHEFNYKSSVLGMRIMFAFIKKVSEHVPRCVAPDLHEDLEEQVNNQQRDEVSDLRAVRK